MKLKHFTAYEIDKECINIHTLKLLLNKYNKPIESEKTLALLL